MANQQGDVRAFPGEDRITKLTEDLRQQILKLLPRRYAIRTGVLCKTWKDLWKQRYAKSHRTILKFACRYQGGRDQQQFVEQIQQYMMQHGNQKIENFHLYFHPENQNTDKVTKWIEQAIENGVEELFLDFSQGIISLKPSGQLASWTKKYRLNECVFRPNGSLIGLTIKFCILNRNFKFRYFAYLESLSLQGVNVNDSMLQKLLSNCLHLQSMELRECMCLRRIMVIGAHLRLKKLTVVHCRNAKEINILSPMLSLFHFFGKFPNIFSIGFNSCLSDVIIISSERDQLQSQNNWDLLLVGLDNVQVMTLCSTSLQLIFDSDDAEEINLNNLRELQLRIEEMKDIDLQNIYKFFVWCRLQELEKLFIELPTSWSDPDLDLSLELVTKDPPRLNLDNLTIIKLNNFKGHANEILLFEFLMQNAINLSLVILSFLQQPDGIVSNATTLFDQLRQKPRASPNAAMVMTYTSLDNHYNLHPMHSKTIPGFFTRE